MFVLQSDLSWNVSGGRRAQAALPALLAAWPTGGGRLARA